MKKYESKRHAGVFAETTGELNEQTQMLTMVFADGKTQDISTATLKRWWKPVVIEQIDVGSDDNTSDILVETPEDITFTDTTADETHTDTPTEIVEMPVEETPVEAVPVEETPVVETPTEEEAPKKTRKKYTTDAKVSADDLTAFRDTLEQSLSDMGLTKVNYAMDNVTLFRAGKKTVIRLYYGKRNLVFHVHPEIVPDGMQYDTQKYFMSAVFHEDYSKSTLNFVKNLMSVYNSNN